MAIQDDLKVIKQEISTEEHFLENIIKGERFFKRYKKFFISLVIIAVIVCVAFYTNKFINQNRIEAANKAYSELILDPNNQNALNILKDKEPSLYALFKFKTYGDNNQSEIKKLLNEPIDPMLKEIFSMQIGDSDSEIGSDYTILMNAFNYLKQNKIKEANAEFAKIPPNSPLTNLVKSLQHYQGYKK
ncbi:hypothetical protein [Campylobacter pinnipediorum]|uniref:hypothetical protein n=1 Tax=Campylobacter pinnipediorum TaxID=1965231 RepID=UPI000994FE62|nr:hypothetical protein [Campylobacter pinnipediorum]AQW83648.1 hypothetical protein CPIN17261_1663 [Campylobacter pinnipediorum subsp. pinnipediorum]